MNLKLGLSSYAYYWAVQTTGPHQSSPLSAWDLLEKVTALDLEVLQICENLPLIDLAPGDLIGLGEAARRLGVILEVGARGSDVESLIRYLEVTHLLGAHLLRLSPWSGLKVQQRFAIDKLRQVVDQLLPRCREYEVTLAIENYFDLPDQELAAFVQGVKDDHVGVCLDTANSVGLLEKPPRTAELLAPFAVSLHLKDFVVSKPVMGYVVSGVPLGQGWLDAQAVLDVVSRAGRHPNVLLELWVDPAEDYAATVRKENEWVRQSVDFARHHLGIQPVRA
jgi:sugar phosphate isomerase/epimerase